VWRRPWRTFAASSWTQRRTLIQLGLVLGAMNACFYIAISRLPLATVGTIEFLGSITLAAIGLRTWRNVAALAIAVAGVFMLTRVRLDGEPLGFVFAFANCALFMLYVVLGHRIARDGGAEGIDRLSVAMFMALIAVMPIGVTGAAPAFVHPYLLAAGVGVGVCSSVIPYVCDQLALARLLRASFALLLSLLPASATAIGVIVLHQVPHPSEILGVCLVICGVALNRQN
jgi:inner membrane transporter RhtA